MLISYGRHETERAARNIPKPGVLKRQIQAGTKQGFQGLLTKVASLVMLGSVTIVVIDVRQYGQREAPPPRRMICVAHALQHCEWPQGQKRVVRGASMQMTHI